MKRISTLIFLISFYISSNSLYAQNVGIGTTGPNGRLDVRVPTGAGTWDRFVVNTTSEWGDGTTQYVTIGAGGAAGIMLSNPHVTWRDNRSSIRYGRVGGVSTGAYWDAGVRADASFTINLNGSTEYLTVESNGNVGVGAVAPSQKLDIQGNMAHSGFLLSRGATYTSTWMQYDEDQYGNSLILGAGGLTAIGAGESATQVRNNVAPGTETLYLASDNGVEIRTNMQGGWATGVAAVSVISNGNVGIGDAAPAQKLEVAGNTSSHIYYDRDNTTYYVDPASTSLVNEIGWGKSFTRTQDKADAGAMGGRSGFYETSAPSPATSWPSGASSWWHLIESRHSNTGNNYALQLAGSFFDQRLYFRKTNNSASTPWSEIYTTSNPPPAVGDNLGNHTATTNLAMQALEIDNVRYVDVTAGVGHGVRFWQSDSYAINMGNGGEFTLGAVSDYSIKMNMNNQSNRGWTWGVDGLTPVASLNTQGIMRIDNRLEIDGNTVIDDGAGWHRSYGSTGWYNGTYGGGIYMIDGTWIRTYGNKSFYHNTGTMRTDGTFEVGPSGNRFLVRTDGNVGVNTTAPAHQFHVYRNTNPGAGNTVILGQNAGASAVGTAGSITNTTNTYGAVEGNTNAPNGIGVKGLHLAGSGGGYGVYGSTNAPGYGWGGYFIGDVYCSRYYYGSDERFKKDIESLTEYSVLDKLMQLEPKVYEYNTDKYPGLGVKPGSKNFGFIAQDLAQLFPEVVTNEKTMDDPTRMPTALGAAEPVSGYYLVDYVSMVPLLVQGIQEQQEIIKKLEDRIVELEKKQK